MTRQPVAADLDKVGHPDAAEHGRDVDVEPVAHHRDRNAHLAAPAHQGRKPRVERLCARKRLDSGRRRRGPEAGRRPAIVLGHRQVAVEQLPHQRLEVAEGADQFVANIVEADGAVEVNEEVQIHGQWHRLVWHALEEADRAHRLGAVVAHPSSRPEAGRAAAAGRPGRTQAADRLSGPACPLSG